MNKLDQIKNIVDQVFNMEMSAVRGIEQIALLLDDPLDREVSHG